MVNRMQAITAIMEKQLKDTLKNKTVLIQFVMFPVMVVIMHNTVRIDDMPHNFFVHLFATMYVAMAPLVSMAAVISEEKEKNTLRVLILSNVSPLQYLLGIGCYVWEMCTLGSVVFCAVGGYTGIAAARFLLILTAGILCSLVTGAAIGIGSRNQMAATSVVMPVMMLFSFLPMLATFNDTFRKVARVTYSQQVKLLISQTDGGIGAEGASVIAVNFALTLVVFCLVYRKKGCGSCI